jgi:hypothetical protein
MTAVDLRLGRWEDVLAGVTCDSWISDPPYGKRTHESDAGERSDGHSSDGLAPAYEHLTPEDVRRIVLSWSPRVRDWMVPLTSHDLVPHWEAAFAEAGRYCFAPVPCVMRGMSFRKQGDGPSSWTVYAIAARPREKRFIGSGCLDGAYVGPAGREAGGGRGKPMWLVNALVRDYSKPGALICDSFAGWGTTAAAAIGLGRRFVGAEMDAAAHAEAVRRLGRGVQIDLLEAAPPRSTTQRVRKRRANGEPRTP